MRSAVYSTLAVLLLAQAAGGCAHFKKTPAVAAADRCPSAPGPIGRAMQAHHVGRAPRYGGPQVGTVTYPYYTVRGPRDFLIDDPPSIGR